MVVPAARYWAIAWPVLAFLGASGQAVAEGWPADPFGTAASAPADPCARAPARRTEWNLVDVVDQALCHNPQTRQSWANARYQAEQLGVAKAAYLPTINLTGSATRGTGGSLGGLQGGSLGIGTGGFGSFGGTGSSRGQTAEQTRLTSSASVSYLLFDFGGRESKLDNARLALDAADWTHAATLQNVLFTAVQAYYQLFAAQAALEASELAEKSAAESYEAARVRHEVGAAAAADELQAKTAYAQATYNRQKAAGAAKVAEGTLANAMGLDAGSSLAAATPALPEAGESDSNDVKVLIEAAKVARPDLAAAEAQVAAAEAGVRTARAAGLPSLSFTGNYGYSDSSLTGSFQSWSVGVQVSVPLFTGFSNAYQIRGAERQVAVQEANRDRLSQTVALDVWNAYHNLNTARELLHSSAELLASAAQSERVALGRYKAGAGNVLDLLNAQASLANARYQQVQARYDWLIGKARLAQAMGRLDSVDAAG